ncbi:mycofactocin-coupled SDR family oxidoreductase [Antrihabitans cavernicola]|uniref:NAD(P)-dependent oxidoreductase n=1 Tax=Antrihabitans cavernicola TaxID=2495913 RepID=A0A5A7S5D7_9NOCA|nr:mycofactocin-coupled SDR family oxidoreductase [Spelaeibacter cavernicola]KAA0018382.1 NAD(P)-dependent oxidoreductase [Spelaeibacter cavernicola]
MGQFDGKVAFITGVARSQGRNHAIRLAREGANIIGVDICARVSEDSGYVHATPEDLVVTRELIEAEGGKALLEVADVRDSAALADVVQRGVAQFGRLDIVIANAGICNWNRFWEMSDDQWSTLIDVNLTGAWKTLKAAVPTMIEANNGGSIIVVSSVAGIKSLPGQAHYSAAKHGLVGLTKSAAIELGEFKIRVNSIHPYGVNTPMGLDNDALAMFQKHPRYLASFGSILTDSPIAAEDDITEAILYLAGDGARMVTGTQLSIDMGATKV